MPISSTLRRRFVKRQVTPRYDTQQGLPFLDLRAVLVDRRVQQRYSAESPPSVFSALGARQSADVRSFPIAYSTFLASRLRFPSPAQPHSYMKSRKCVVEKTAALLPPPFPIAPVALTHRCKAHRDRLRPDSAPTSRRHPWPDAHHHRRAQRPPRPFLLAGITCCLRVRRDALGVIPL
ncbi:hypothetical protein B0H19DRAFT_1384701 [Mycena capillaripes]|nr:hypothetical protein B0H19DRAFT_1384701 [Mycena capillaripes]